MISSCPWISKSINCDTLPGIYNRQGCDASILLEPSSSATKSEIISSRNFGIRKRELVNHIKSVVEVTCPGRVSCADIITLAARDAVALSGGPQIAIPLGRKDSRTSSPHLADAHLPPPNISVDEFIKIFSSKGMSLEESVAILGKTKEKNIWKDIREVLIDILS